MRRHKKIYKDCCSPKARFRYPFEIHPKYRGQHQNRNFEIMKTHLKHYKNPLNTWYTRTPNREIPNSYLFLDSY